MQSKTIDLDALMQGRRLQPIQLLVAVLCALVALLDGVDTQSFAIAAPSIAHAFSMDVKQFGTAFGIAHAGAFLGAIVCGPVSDMIGRRRVLITATLIFAVFTVLTATAGSYDLLLMMRFCAGIGLGGAVPCFLALASEYAPPGRRGTLASVLWAAFPLGGMVGGFTNSYIVGHYGWPMMFYVGGVLPILVAAVMLAVLPESPAFLASRDSGSPVLRGIAERIAGRPIDPQTRFLVQDRRTKHLPVRELFAESRTAVTLLLWPGFFAAFALLTLVVSWTPAVLQGAGISTAGSALVLGFFNIGAVIGMGSAGRLVDRFGANLALLPALAIAAVLTWLFGMVSTLTEAALVTALIGLFLGCGASGLIAIASTYYTVGVRSTGIGWGMAMGRLGQVAAPFGTGALMMAAGLPIAHVMQLMVVLPIVAGAAVFLVSMARQSGRVENLPVAGAPSSLHG